MNKKILLYTSLAILLSGVTSTTFAATTNPQVFVGALAETNMVTPNGGIIDANINPTSGALDVSFSPGFTITTTAGGGKFLTQSWSCNTTDGTQNAIFNTGGSVPYLILTNTDALPGASSVNNIKTGSPTPASNPNAIAYLINDPPNISGVIQTEFEPTTNTWKIHVSKNGATNTSQTVPGTAPFTNTFSGEDEAGRYQATVLLSFNP